jgi:hypothetical protein
MGLGHGRILGLEGFEDCGNVVSAACIQLVLGKNKANDLIKTMFIGIKSLVDFRRFAIRPILIPLLAR